MRETTPVTADHVIRWLAFLWATWCTVAFFTWARWELTYLINAVTSIWAWYYAGQWFEINRRVRRHFELWEEHHEPPREG